MPTRYFKYIIFTGLFLIPFIPFLVSSYFFFPFITTKAFAWRMIVEIIFAAWLLLALWDEEYRPRKSWVLYAIAAFLSIIGLADLLGVDPFNSFWSNFERMEGFITLLHLGAFFLVVGSVFQKNHWKWWWNTTLVASGIMVLYCFSQILGVVAINQGGVRVDGTLGNAIYLAVYMLFHIFIATLFLWREWKNVALRWTYGLLILAQVLILYFTATRGAILGLLGGVLIAALLNIRNREDQLVRKFSIGVVTGLAVLVGGFFLIKDTSVVSNSPVLSRFSSLNMGELKTQGRYFVWPMAIEGFKERPIFGWGQENFPYVFQKYYSPEMYHLEPWFDRAHNIFLDYLVAAGFLGLLAYLSLYLVTLYLIWWRDQSFTYAEKSILTGLLAAYFFHNFFVFDHLISYILFFSLLAYLHSRNATMPLWEKLFSENSARKFTAAFVAVVLLSSLYILNFKPLRGNLALIEALKTLQTPGQIAKAASSFKMAYNNNALLGRSETLEQMTGNATPILQSDLSLEEKNDFFLFVKNAAAKEAEDLKRNARTQLFIGSFLATTRLLDEALSYLKRANELMPNKQQIHFEIGSAYINKNEKAEALEAFKQAYDLAPAYLEAKVIYLMGAIYNGDRVLEQKLLTEIPEEVAAFDNRVASAYFNNKRLGETIAILDKRIALDPQNENTYREYIKQVESAQK